MSTTDCQQQLESLKLSDHSADKTSNDGGETILKVPKKFAEFPLGFALDAGGSVTKIVYRSKLDYTDGQPNNGEHVLRIRFFPSGKGHELVEFLKENCDVRITSIEGDKEGRPLYYMTGLGVNYYADKLEDTFKCRINCISEYEAVINGVLRVTDLISQLKETVPISVESAAAALKVSREFIQAMQKFREAGISAFGDTEQPQGDFDIAAFLTKIFTVDPAILADEVNSSKITYPCVLVQCGSASGAIILQENGRYFSGDFNSLAGKTVLGFGRLLTGAKNFEELIELASKGDSRKVDFLTGDLKNKNRDPNETDWYSLMTDSFPVFALGKPAEARFDGTYTKADIAAALIGMHCRQLCHFGACAAMQHQVASIVFAGSFVQWPLTQQLVHQQCLTNNGLLPLVGAKPITTHIIPHAGFLTVLGVWYKNVKQELEELP